MTGDAGGDAMHRKVLDSALDTQIEEKRELFIDTLMKVFGIQIIL
jgi:hypothetical protein